MSGTQPRAEFFSIYPDAPLPTRASDDLQGLMPLRASQLCLPLRAASGFGFYAYPPVDFALRWDGQRSEITWLDQQAEPGGWHPLDGGTEVFLEASESAPDSVEGGRRDQIPQVMDLDDGVSFINAHPRNQHEVEITSGLIARTPPGWGLLVRPIPNFPHATHHQILDGFVETDWYRGFVPFILRLSTPGAVVRFFRHMPIASLQVVPLEGIEAQAISPGDSAGMGGWPEDVWQEFLQSRGERSAADRQRGTYLRAAKRAAKNDRAAYAEGR